jgi:predicted neutral ceramidase superfamily lipid hydrolase
VQNQTFETQTLSTASNEIEWRKPRNVLTVAAWSVTNATIAMGVFLTGSPAPQWYFLLLLLFISIFAGMLLQDLKTIILGIFEALFLTVLLTYIFMVLPAFISGVSYYEAQVIYTGAVGWTFTMFFPLFPIILIMGAIIGGFAEDWIY